MAFRLSTVIVIAILAQLIGSQASLGEYFLPSKMTFSHDAKYFATSNEDGADLYIWNTETGHRTTINRMGVRGHSDDIVFSPLGKLLVVGYWSQRFNNSIVIYDRSTLQELRVITVKSRMDRSFDITPDGSQLIIYTEEGELLVYEGPLFETLVRRLVVKGKPPFTHFRLINNHVGVVLHLYDKRSAVTVDVDTGSVVARIDRECITYNSTLGNSAALIASSFADRSDASQRTIRVCDLMTGKLRNSFVMREVFDIAFTPDSNSIAVLELNAKGIKFRNPLTDELQGRLRLPENFRAGPGVLVSPDGSLVAAASGGFALIDAKTGAFLRWLL
jgi:WD40 repeat protein